MNQQRVQLNKQLRQFYQNPVAQVSLEVFFSIVAVIFFAMFAIRPTLITMSNLVKELNDKKALNEQLKQKIAALSSVQSEYSIVQPKLALLEEAIPSDPSFENAMLQLEKIASDRQVIISNAQIKELPKKSVATDAAQLTRLSKPVALDVEGDYNSIRQFIEDIGSLRRQMSVDAIQFNLTDILGQKKLRATLTINIHYFGIDPTLAVEPPSAPIPGGTDAVQP